MLKFTLWRWSGYNHLWVISKHGRCRSVQTEEITFKLVGTPLGMDQHPQIHSVRINKFQSTSNLFESKFKSRSTATMTKDGLVGKSSA